MQNEVVYNQGEPSNFIYIILRGTVVLQVKKMDMGN